MPYATGFSASDAKALEMGLHLHDLLAREAHALALHELDEFADLTVSRHQAMARWKTCLGALGETAGRVAQALDLRLQAMAADNDERAKHVLSLQAEALRTVLDGHADRIDAAIPWTTYAIERDDARPMAA